MKVEVRVRGLGPASHLREHATRRVDFQLSRFGHEIAAVLVLLARTELRDGAEGAACAITVRGARFGSLSVEDRSRDPLLVIDGALDRSARAVGRALERLRSGHRERAADEDFRPTGSKLSRNDSR